METKNVLFKGYLDDAEFETNYSVIQCILQDDRQWASHVLGSIIDDKKYCKNIKFWNRLFRSRIIPQSPDSFIALGSVGLMERLVYQIERLNDNLVKVTPFSYMEAESKIGTAVFLGIFFLLPAFISPILWKKTQRTNLLISKLCLPRFCEYLDKAGNF